jgi:acyl-CoA synthetase (AMP-forming)/AMP-acid ligase II
MQHDRLVNSGTASSQRSGLAVTQASNAASLISPAGPPTTVQELLVRAFRRYGSRDLLIWEGGRATYSQTFSRCGSLANWLIESTPPGAHVGILLDNCREYIEIILVCALAGRVRVPIGAKESLQDQLHKMSSCSIDCLVTTEAAWEQCKPRLNGCLNVLPLIVGMPGHGYEEIVTTACDRVPPAVPVGSRYRLSFTGGTTTGAPKAIIQTDRQEQAMIRNLLLEVISPGEATVFMAATPLSHASGAFVVPTLLRGGALSWVTSFDAEKLGSPSWVGDRAVESFLVPTALADLCEVHSIRPSTKIIYGGAVCPSSTFEKAVARLERQLVQVYGQAEAPMTICVLPESEHYIGSNMGGGCAGFPFNFVDVKIAGTECHHDVGELMVRGEHVMEGYLGDRDATSEKIRDGWLNTQDLAQFDDEGRIWIVGRTKEMIITGGYNVYPAEVERKLGRITGVHSLSVFGVKHPRWGEAVVLAVALSEGADPSAVRSEVGQSSLVLSPYERPKEVVLVTEMPLTPIGKISRADLAMEFADLFTAADKPRDGS